VLDEVGVEPTCRRLMTVPDAGPLTALAFRATIDQPDRFRKSRDVGAHLDLIPRRYQSGETDLLGRISRCGEELVRTAHYEAAHSLLIRSTKWSALRAWKMSVAERRGMARPRRGGPPAGSDPAPHLGRRQRVPSGQAGHGADASRVTTGVQVPA